MNRALLIAWLAVVSVISTEALQADVIHREKSLYRNIEVTETNERRCLIFAVRQTNHNQSCIDLADPKKIVFPYVRMTLAGLLVQPEIERALIVGLGGGTVPLTLSELYPDAVIDSVEIDPAVVRVAEEHFGFKPNQKLTVAVQDARVFVRRQLARGHRYDYILLDAFTGEYIPEHLMTKEFLTEIKRLLTKDGVVVANTFSSSRLYHHESATYADVFGELYTMRLPTSGNRIILGARSGNLPTKDILEQRANTLGSALTPFGVALAAFPKYITDRVDWDSGAAVLTDQYAPANLLNRP